MNRRFAEVAKSLPLILFMALAMRLGYAWNYGETHTRQGLSTIPFLFEPGNIAASVASGNGFSSPLRVPSGPTAWMTPLYPLLLAGIFRLFGAYTFAAYVAAAGLNIAASVVTCIPIFFTGRRLRSTALGAGAAWLWAVFPNAIILPVESMWDASLAALLAACILWATLAVVSSRRTLAWIAYGLLWGVALMTSAALALMLPILLGWMAYRSRDAGWRNPAIAGAVAVLCCIPWTVRNYVVFGEFVPLRSVMGVSLWMGAIDPANGRWPGSYHPLADAAEREKYLAMGELPYMQWKREEAFRFWREHPGVEARLTGERAVAFWSGGATNPIRSLIQARTARTPIVLALNWIFFLGALCGIVHLFRGGHSFTMPLVAWMVVFPLPYYVTLASARYRLPLDPALLLLAAIGLASFRKLPAASHSRAISS